VPARTTPDRLKNALIDADYPATKEQLLEVAQRNGADEETIKVLRGVPPVDYRNFSEVLASVTTPDTDRDPKLEAAVRAQAHRVHRKPGLSEVSKDVPPINPIVEELGENRGS
jgi:hypothetical protein